MITFEDIQKANKKLDTIPVKGKDYVQVNERVKAFRSVCPGGVIETEMVYYEGGRVMFKATVKDQDDRILATGYAEEKEGSTMINKTSFIENCETSAVGRALGFAGIGIDGSMASAEEVATAIINQNALKNAADLINPTIKGNVKLSPAKPNYPLQFLSACKFAAGGSTLGKLYKENRPLFDNLRTTGTPEEVKNIEIILEYMEGKK